jgi:hypothetical protein
MQRFGIEEEQPKQQEKGTGHADEAQEPTEKLAEKVAEGVLEQPIKRDTQQAAGQAIHWSYGAAWGAFYGIVQGSLRLPDLLAGTLFGAIVGGVASTLVPSMGLTPPPSEQPVPRNAMQMGLTMLYGLSTALAFRLLCKNK